MEYNDLKNYQKVENLIEKIDSMKLELEDVLGELNPKDPDKELSDRIQSNMAALEGHEIEEDALLYNEIQRRQAVLDAGWDRHRQKYINGFPVSDEEYEDYLENERMEAARAEEELSFYRRCTSTGEEWETDSDGDFTPDWLYDEI